MTDTSANKSIEFPSTSGQCNSHGLADNINKECYCCDVEDVLTVLNRFYSAREEKVAKEPYQEDRSKPQLKSTRCKKGANRIFVTSLAVPNWKS